MIYERNIFIVKQVININIFGKWVGWSLQGYKGVLKQTLIIEIEKARENMIQVALEEGMTSDNALQVSQFIDQLLNELHKIRLTK
ncbi:hypothetical protein BMEGG_06019 [Priestia megaterium]